MLNVDTPCVSCDATGKTPQGYQRVPLLDDGTPDYSVLRESFTPDPAEEVEVVACSACKGHKGPDGRTYARYRDKYDAYPQPYASVSTLKAALTRGKARACHRCRAKGREAHLPKLSECYSCGGTGKSLTWDPDVDPVLPPGFDKYASAPPDFMAAYLATATVVAVRVTRGLTWGEAHLGLGSLYTCTDYGRAFDGPDDLTPLVNAVRESLMSGTQFVKLVDAETQRFGNLVLIEVTRNGYTVKVADAKQVMPLLPPTYYPRVHEEM